MIGGKWWSECKIQNEKGKMKSAWHTLLKFGFRLLYNEMAFTYDLVANVVSLGQWWDWQRTALPFLPDPAAGTILELAHGTGRLQVDLHAGGWRSIGYDLSPNMSRITQHRLHKKRLPARLVRGMAQHLPFPNETFSAVISTFPTPFIVEAATLQEVHRVLQPGRRLIFVPTGVLTKGGIARQALENAYRVTGQRSGWGMDLPAHFKEHGFEVTIHTIELKRSITQVIVAEKM